VSAVLDALKAPEFSALVWRQAPRATMEALARAHAPDLTDLVLKAAIGPDAFFRIDADTVLSAGSAEAALRAAGAACAAVDAVAVGQASNAFCAVRPPGHHAERAAAMGFCLFNNVAVGALHARAVHGVGRVAIVDFDVHHGNGTQDIFWNDPDTLYISTHQSPLYPGSGRPEERGAHGNIVNLPLSPGSDGGVFRAAMADHVLPALIRFAPEFLFISAGFDASAADPLADLAFVAEDFGHATGALARFAGKACGGRIVSTLEGGYDLAALAAGAAAHIRALMEA
jgi:acetoin utilization deacetylase AcuC-like enzyme